MKSLVVITGGSKGIGKALAKRFAQENFDIVTCGRSISALQNLEKTIKELNPSTKVHYKVVDVSRKEEVFHFASFIKSLAQPIQVLINNAGVFIPGKISDEDDEILAQMIDTNLYSAYHLTKALLPEMIDKHTDIFNICSIASQIAYPNGGSYSISKFALYGFSKVLREELKTRKVRVTAVLPGATLTNSWEGTDLPETRFIKVEDIAEAVWATYSLSRNTVVEELLIRPQLGDI